MKKYFLLLLIIVSCSKEKEYKSALEKYVKNDLVFKQLQIDYQLESLKGLSIDQPIKYEPVYKDALLLNKYFIKLENKIINNNNIKSINSYIYKFKDTISKLELSNYDYVNKEINKLQNIDNEIEKFVFFKKFKKIK